MSTAPETTDPLTAWRDTLEAADLAPTTIRAYTIAVRLCTEHAGISDPLDLTPDDVIAFLRRPALARNTKSRYYRSLAAWARWLEATGRPAALLAGVQAARPQRTQPKPITTEQLHAVLAAAGTNPSLRGMILLGAYAGLRVHEIARFRGDQLDHRDGTLHVVGKGSKPVELPASKVILDHAQRMPAGWWFPTVADPTKPRNERSVGSTITRAMAKAGYTSTPHALRHWYATSLVRAGVPLTTVRILMRHESLRTTQMYVRVDWDEQVAGVALLPGLAGLAAAS